MPGTKKRAPLFDDQGERIRGKKNKAAAEVALAKETLSWDCHDESVLNGNGQWLVARVCSDYIQYCEQGLAKGALSKSHSDNSVRWLNDLCGYCGALPVAQLKKGHVTRWIDEHDTWKSSETRRGVIAVVLAAFNRADEMFGVANPLKGLKKPKPKPAWRHSVPPTKSYSTKARSPASATFSSRRFTRVCDHSANWPG